MTTIKSALVTPLSSQTVVVSNMWSSMSVAQKLRVENLVVVVFSAKDVEHP